MSHPGWAERALEQTSEQLSRELYSTSPNISVPADVVKVHQNLCARLTQSYVLEALKPPLMTKAAIAASTWWVSFGDKLLILLLRYRHM